jgi:hypothetical protein
MPLLTILGREEGSGSAASAGRGGGTGTAASAGRDECTSAAALSFQVLDLDPMRGSPRAISKRAAYFKRGSMSKAWPGR